MLSKWIAVVTLGLSSAACAVGPDDLDPGDQGGDGKADSGWIADDSYEVGAVLRGSVTRTAEGDWAEIATSAALQAELIETQVKFAKTSMFARGWHVNQLTDGVRVLGVDTAGAKVTLTYEATIDMIHAIDGEVPTLATLDPKRFQVPLPADPVGMLEQAGQTCADNDLAEGDASEYNYYYYFDPAETGCTAALVQADLEVTTVFERRTAYPEYDRLLGAHGDGTFGFKVALVPDEGDYDAKSRFDAHKRMLERDLRLTGVDDAENHLRRYEWRKGDVKIVIDLYDPTQSYLTDRFRSALGKYEFILYNGHSSYGTRDLLTDADSFSERYQIVMMHSCRSYPYYVRQIFRAKATAADPRGWDLADVIATGESSYPADSPRTLRVALRGLMDGIEAVHGGRPEAAPSWHAIIHGMNGITEGILYGAAGVRENSWQPSPAAL